MSDIPELDRLIEESENFRRNKKWRRQDRIFKLSILFGIFSFVLFFFSIFVFGPEIASIILTCFFVASIVPVLCEALIGIIHDLLKDDWEGRDMTKRYQRK